MIISNCKPSPILVKQTLQFMTYKRPLMNYLLPKNCWWSGCLGTAISAAMSWWTNRQNWVPPSNLPNNATCDVRSSQGIVACSHPASTAEGSLYSSSSCVYIGRYLKGRRDRPHMPLQPSPSNILMLAALDWQSQCSKLLVIWG